MTPKTILELMENKKKSVGLTHLEKAMIETIEALLFENKLLWGVLS